MSSIFLLRTKTASANEDKSITPAPAGPVTIQVNLLDWRYLEDATQKGGEMTAKVKIVASNDGRFWVDVLNEVTVTKAADAEPTVQFVELDDDKQYGFYKGQCTEITGDCAVVEIHIGHGS